MSVAGCLAKSLGLLYLFLAGAGLGCAVQPCKAAVLQSQCCTAVLETPMAWVQTWGGKTLKTSQNKIHARYLEFLQFYLEDGAHLINPVLPHE